MEIFTQVLSILGIGALIVIVAFVILVAVFLRKLKSMLAGGGNSPVRIHLQEQESPQWQAKEKVERIQREIIGLGFKDLGCFKVNEMPTLTMNAFVKGAEGLLAIIYEMPQAGVWTDIVAYCEDGYSITSSTNTIGKDLRQQPKHKKIRSAQASPYELLQMLEKENIEKPRKIIEESKTKFVSIFEKAYADEIDWRNSLGGPTEEEIRAIARASGQNASDEAIAQTLLIQQMKACSGLTVAFAEKYREKHGLSEEDWQQVQHDLLFVHDKMPAEFLKTILKDAGIEDTEKTEHYLKSLSPREAFLAVLNASSLSPSQKPEKIDELEEPLTTDVYKLVRQTHEA